MHLYWECPMAKPIWDTVIQLFRYISPARRYQLDVTTMLLGYDYIGKHILNEICTLLTVLAKHFLHVSKCLGDRPLKNRFLIYVKNISKVEENIYRNNGKLTYYQKKWEGVNTWLLQ